jgi:hypothetical protein
MTAIEGIGRSSTTRPPGRASGATSTGFALPPEPAAAKPMASAAPAPVTSLGSMLTLQEVAEMSVEDREARRHGQDVLALLRELQHGLLVNWDDESAVARLTELAATVPHATDRRLAALLSAVILRARVELARRQL